MAAPAPVLAVDVGSETITAAAAMPSKQPSPEVLHFGRRSDYPVSAKVDIEGAPHPATWSGDPVAFVRQPALLLDRPPQIIGDVPLSGATLVGVSLGPAISAARATFGSEPDTIVGVHPQWPASKLADFKRGLARQGQDVALVPWAEAIAAQTTPPLTGSHVTVLDFGASTASIIVVKFSRRGTPSVAYTHTDRAGGARGADRAVVAHCARERGADLSDCGNQWWDRAARAISRMRRSPSRNGVVPIKFPDPLGSCTVSWHDINRITNSHMQDVVRGLTNADEVQQAWEADRTDAATLPILEATGGFALDPAVELAVRATVGPVTVVEEPGSAAAFGAVMLEAPKWIPAPEPSQKKGLFGRRKKVAS